MGHNHPPFRGGLGRVSWMFRSRGYEISSDWGHGKPLAWKLWQPAGRQTVRRLDADDLDVKWSAVVDLLFGTEYFICESFFLLRKIFEC